MFDAGGTTYAGVYVVFCTLRAVDMLGMGRILGSFIIGTGDSTDTGVNGVLSAPPSGDMPEMGVMLGGCMGDAVSATNAGVDEFLGVINR